MGPFPFGTKSLAASATSANCSECFVVDREGLAKGNWITCCQISHRLSALIGGQRSLRVAGGGEIVIHRVRDAYLDHRRFCRGADVEHLQRIELVVRHRSESEIGVVSRLWIV